eukprot:TRINITY_DN28941_c0_g1_i1.p1 TRINITY_DN28941_c0_g1~~TRINITY_DN28941_c0_g1_i1.p1  ORF type:complete len:495 (+),score=110.01 TRINITY_DN28941_c0_g1_i1:1036-2520(+)
MTIEAWYMDSDTEADQRLPHRKTPNEPASMEVLSKLGVFHWTLDADNWETDEELKRIRAERGYSYHDIVCCCEEKLENYEAKLKSFYMEHIHTDDEVRYALEGTGYFDVRDTDDKWIRIAVKKGDLITLPAGIYHRFTLDTNNYIKAMRLFIGDPIWTPYNRPDADDMPERRKFLDLIAQKSPGFDPLPKRQKVASGFRVKYPLTQEAVSAFHENGFLVIEGFTDAAQCHKLEERMTQLIDAWDPSEQLTVFSTTEQSKKTMNSYMLGSHDQTRFFLEERAVKEGKLAYPKHLAINKAGHGLHYETVFKEFVQRKELADVARALGQAEPVVPQTMYIFKQPAIGGEVVLHQDSSFLYTEPPSCLGLLLALHEATTENGCLWAIPGSHKQGVLRQYKRVGDAGAPEMKFFDSNTYEVVTGPAPDTPELQKELVAVEVKPGDLVVLHGAVLHSSRENTSEKPRHIFQIHAVDGKSKWVPENWMQSPSAFPPLGADY